MVTEGKQIGVRVDEQLWQQFRDDVKERNGRVNGHLASEVETALREYLDASHGGDVNDRLARLEHQIENIAAAVENDEAKKQDSGVGNRVEDRFDEIVETVENEADGAPRVHDSVVEMAIEQHAGMSDPTMRQYKELLRDREVALPDPRGNSNYHYLDAPQYCSAVNEMRKEGEITRDEYIEVVEDHHTRDWWQQQLQTYEERQKDNTPNGFQ